MNAKGDLMYDEFFRHILAAVHFNYNLHRDVKERNADEVERVKLSYPKFKNGEATVRDVRITQNFGKFKWDLYNSSTEHSYMYTCRLYAAKTLNCFLFIQDPNFHALWIVLH